MKYLSKPQMKKSDLTNQSVLPYEIKPDEIFNAIEKTHNFFHDINNFLVSNNYSRLEDLMLGNSFAGFLSEIVVKNLSDCIGNLERNTKIGGYPDLIPKGKYPNNSVLHGEGIEVKCSKQRGGWQGHNPEVGWILICRYSIDTETQPIIDRAPTEIIEVLCANLTEEDWQFSGRSETSRRTITASIIKSGMEKLRSNIIYSKNQK
jgi:hypothetical protein